MNRRSVLALAALCVAVALGPGPRSFVARAQTPSPVAISCRTGLIATEPNAFFSRRSRIGDWVPFQIRIANAGPALSGTLAVTTTGYSGRVSRFEKRIDLPSGSQQSHEILARVTGRAEAPKVSFEADGETVATIDFDLADEGGSNAVRIGVVDRDGTALNDVSGVAIDPAALRVPFVKQSAAPAAAAAAPNAVTTPPYAASMQNVSLRPFVMDAAELPRATLAYDGLDALVLNDAPLADLDGERAQAITSWVARGGLLVVAGGADFAGLRRAGLDALLPLDVQERRAFAAAPIFAATYGGFESDSAPLLATGALRQSARALVADGGQVLVAERRYGAGTVRFLALDPKLPPSRGWSGAALLWQDLVHERVAALASPSSYGPSYSATMDRTGMLFTMADLNVPLVGYYFLYLLAYLLAIGPANYFALRRIGRLELAWITIPALVLAFSVGLIAVARLARGGRAVATSASVRQFFEREGVGIATTHLLVVPASKGDYAVTFPKGSVAFAADESMGGPEGALRTTLDLSGRDPSFSAQMMAWQANLVEGVSAGPAESPVDVAASDTGVSVTNNGGETLTHVAVLTRAGVFTLPDIPAGGRAASSTPPAFPGGSFSGWYEGELAGSDYLQRYFRTVRDDNDLNGPGGLAPGPPFSLVSLDLTGLASLEAPILVAASENAPSPAVLDASARGRHLDLLFVTGTGPSEAFGDGRGDGAGGGSGR